MISDNGFKKKIINFMFKNIQIVNYNYIFIVMNKLY